MKRILILLTFTILAFAQCTHPYEIGMEGSFPFFEMTSPAAIQVEAGDRNGEEFAITMHSNLSIDSEIDCEENWLHFQRGHSKDNIVTLTFKADQNPNRFSRQATIKIKADGSLTGHTIKVEQKAFEFTSTTSNPYEGDLYLYGQEEVNNCIYTSVTGNLIIYDANNLSPLEHISEIGGSLLLYNCGLSNLGPLSDIIVEELFLNSTSDVKQILKNFTGKFRSLSIINGHADFSIISRFTDLEALTISDDCTVENLLEITKLTNLKSAYLYEPAVTRAEINYINMLMPKVVWHAQDYQTSFHLEARGTEDVSTRMYMYMSFRKNPSLQKVGYILSDNGTCDFSEMVEINDWTLNVGKEFTITDLTPNTDYSIWLYAVSTDGRHFLSEVETFRTIIYNYYAYSVTPEYPTYSNINETPYYSRFGGYMYKNSEIQRELDFYDNGAGRYEVTLPEGTDADILLYAPMSAVDSYNFEFDARYATNTWSIILNNESGSDSDLVLFKSSHNFFADVNETASFERPVAKINLNVDFSQSIGSLDDIQEVEVMLNYFYGAYIVKSNGNNYHEYYTSYRFSKATNSPKGTINIVSDKYIMPSLTEYYTPSATVTLKFKNGETIETEVDLPSEGIEANKAYDVIFGIQLNRPNGTFTVDEVEIVDGGRIEF